jgi:Predicted transcriptional regulators
MGLTRNAERYRIRHMTTTPVERNEATTPLRETTAEEIRSLMARRRLSGVDLAGRIGRSQSYFSRRLTGETAFDIDDLEGIAQVLGVTVTTLIRRNGGATEGYPAPTRRVDPLAVHVVATVGDPNRQPRPTQMSGRRRRAVRTGRPANRTSTSRPVTTVAVG